MRDEMVCEFCGQPIVPAQYSYTIVWSGRVAHQRCYDEAMTEAPPVAE